MNSAKCISRQKRVDEMTKEELREWMASDDTPEDLADNVPTWSGTFQEELKRPRGRPLKGTAPWNR